MYITFYHNGGDRAVTPSCSYPLLYSHQSLRRSVIASLICFTHSLAFERSASVICFIPIRFPPFAPSVALQNLAARCFPLLLEGGHVQSAATLTIWLKLLWKCFRRRPGGRGICWDGHQNCSTRESLKGPVWIASCCFFCLNSHL